MMRTIMAPSPTHSLARPSLLALLLVVLLVSAPTGSGRRFYDDDPIGRDVDTEDASGAQPWEIDLIWDLSLNTFATPGRTMVPPRAGNINTIDEVPDSNWFTNRAHALTAEALVRGPQEGPGPAPGPLTISRAKQTGMSPGFTVRDSQGVTWFVSFDARGYPEAATAAVMVANKLFWGLGYWQVENHLLQIRPDQLVIGDTARITPPSGKRRPMRPSDVEEVLARAHRGPDGSYRAVAGKAVPGTPLGGFRHHGTRPDDPNDIVPHEDRRELRALKVFGAWTNLVDMKAGNTLDTIVEENGRKVIRHYLQDVGSTFGAGALGPHDYDEGWEYLYEGNALVKRLVTFGFYIRPWQTVRYVDVPAVGRFEGEEFEPDTWRPRVPTAAFLRARADDNFWAARRVLAFSDDLIRAAVLTGQYSDAKAPEHLAAVLIKRRDRIARAYLPAVNPLIDVALDGSGTLTFVNAAVQAGVAAAPKGYAAEWARFDNATGVADRIADTTGADRLTAPGGLPSADGSYIKVRLRAVDAPHPSWHTPLDAYFRRTGGGWKLVGLDRLP
jgi:hypothetical protein